MPIHGITATYQPFSFQERLAPLQMMKEEYDKINEGIALLGEASNQYYQFLDPATKKEVDDYNAQLGQVAGSLASDGMKAVSRNTLNNLRREYNGRIKHIQEAAQTVGNMQAQIRDMAMKDPTLIVQKVPTVSEVLQDPTVRPSILSGSILQKEGIAAALQLEGVEYDDIRRYLNGDLTAIPGIQQSIDRIASDYGISTDQARGYISRGILAGLGERAAKIEAKREERALDYEYDKRKASYEQGLKNAATQKTLDAQFLASGWKVDPTKSNINERYTFDEEYASKILGVTGGKVSSPGKRTTSKAYSTKQTESYNPRKGVFYVDGSGQNIEELDSNVGGGYKDGQAISTEDLKKLSPAVIDRIFTTLNINYDPSEYIEDSGIDYSRLINDYKGYLDRYQFKEYVRKRRTTAALNNPNHNVIEIQAAGANSAVNTSNRRSTTKSTTTTVTTSADEDIDENDTGE